MYLEELQLMNKIAPYFINRTKAPKEQEQLYFL